MQAGIDVKAITEYAIDRRNGMLAVLLSRSGSVVTKKKLLKSKLELQT